MKHLAKLILLCLLSISLAIYSQDYYWYKDRKIFLQQGNQCYILYHNNYSKDESLLQIIEEGNASIHKDNDLKWAIITQPQPTRLSNVVYQCSSFLCSDTTKNIFVTHRFCVKLRRRNDLAILQDFAYRYHAEFEYTDALPLWYILRCGENSKYNALELANIFYESGLFAACEPEFLNTININCVNDSHFDYQWNLKNTGQYGSSYSGIDINYCDAHSITTGNSSVIIGVYDLGIDLVHPDINIHSFSYDAALQSSPSHIYSINSNNYHGTACAGIIGAKTNNNLGVAGIAPNCPIMSISFSQYITGSNLGLGFKVAADNGCAVISNSWNHNTYSEYIEDGIRYALTHGRNGKGCVVVFSAGNENSNSVNYPANSNDSIIVVGAMSPCGERCNPLSCDAENWGSNYGEKLDILAPGVKIHTTDIAGNDGKNLTDYINDFNGTSSACPHVAAIAGLMLSVNPNLSNTEVKNIIESTAQKIGTSYSPNPSHPNGTWSEYLGYGLVDAYAAVQEAKYRYEHFIQGPDYVCDTTKYYLIHPSQPGDAVLWSVNNGNYIYPHYSIIGANNQDTVYIRCERASVVRTSDSEPQENSNENTSLDDRQILLVNQSVSVSINNGTSNTYTKMFRNPFGTKPEVSVSNTSSLWNSGTSRTFTITNCTDVPDSALTWEVEKTTVYTNGNPSSTSTSYYTGRTLTYTASTPRYAMSLLKITITNTLRECDPKYIIKNFVIKRPFFMSAHTDGDMLYVSIAEDEDREDSRQTNVDAAPQMLELWHNIYGRMRTQHVRSSHEQIDITGLPQGVYVLILKENGNIIAETKVQID